MWQWRQPTEQTAQTEYRAVCIRRAADQQPSRDGLCESGLAAPLLTLHPNICAISATPQGKQWLLRLESFWDRKLARRPDAGFGHGRRVVGRGSAVELRAADNSS